MRAKVISEMPVLRLMFGLPNRPELRTGFPVITAPRTSPNPLRRYGLLIHFIPDTVILWKRERVS